MINKKINLKDEYPVLSKDVYLTVYCPTHFEECRGKNNKRRTILVLPGGGYEYCSDRENEPIALRFLGYNFNCFNLVYNCRPEDYPYPALEGFAALAYIRSHAEEYNVDLDHIGVMGFSAGGHLACTLAMWSKSEEMAKYLKVDKELLRVDFLISCYSVVTMDENNTHLGTMQYVAKHDAKLMEMYSIEKHVTKDFPPSYIWCTEDDSVVPCQNSKALYQACLEAGVKAKCHIFPTGRHGLSLADRSVYIDEVKDEELEVFKDAQNWVMEAIDFIRNL